jgi:hypothetical protein
MEVNNSQLFDIRDRNDRNGLFFDVVGVTFREYIGLGLKGDP